MAGEIRTEGTMLWFAEAKDYGFILTEGGDRLHAPVPEESRRRARRRTRGS